MDVHMADTEKTVGVIGGMGPEATVELMRRLVAATPAVDDADHIHVIIDNNPKIPSRIKALIEGGGEDPAPVLATMARRLQTAGADFLAIPCNTAHHYLEAVRSAVSIPVLDMIDLSVRRLAALVPAPGPIGMLASPAVRLTGLFEKRCADRGLTILYPEGDDDAAVLSLIRAIKAAGTPDALLSAYNAAAARLEARGAAVLLVACTELSFVAPPRTDHVPVIDTLDCLVDAMIAEVKGSESRRVA